VRRAALLAVLAGCFDPRPHKGQPCADNWCPPPETCFRGTCTENAPSYAMADPCQPTAIAPPQITFEGHFVDAADGVTPLGNIPVAMRPGGSTLTQADGLFQSEPVGTDGKPLSVAYSTVAVGEYLIHEVYYQRPFSQSISDLSLKLFKQSTIDGLYTSIARKPGFATVLISLRACDGLGVAGAAFATEPAADGVVYQGGNPSMTDSTGVGYALNATPGPVHLTSGSSDLLVEAEGDTLVVAFLVQP